MVVGAFLTEEKEVWIIRGASDRVIIRTAQLLVLAVLTLCSKVFGWRLFRTLRWAPGGEPARLLYSYSPCGSDRCAHQTARAACAHDATGSVKRGQFVRLSFYRLLFLSSAILSAICSRPAFAEDSKFHPPQTEAEIALDKIFDLEDKDSNMLFFALAMPYYHPPKDTGYAQLFTKALLKAWRKKEADLVRENCGGKYREGEICGLDFDPITCAQDRPDKFVFRTIKSGKESVSIIAAWPQSVNDERYFKYYKLVKEEDVWKLDGVYCRESDNFNMPSPW
jgi:hypothetical protein